MYMKHKYHFRSDPRRRQRPIPVAVIFVPLTAESIDERRDRLLKTDAREIQRKKVPRQFASQAGVLRKHNLTARPKTKDDRVHQV